MAARMESWLLELCLVNLRGLSLKEGSLATRENKASPALLSGAVCMMAGGAEFSLFALSLRYWSYIEPVGELSLVAGDWDLLAWLLVMDAEVIDVG